MLTRVRSTTLIFLFCLGMGCTKQSENQEAAASTSASSANSAKIAEGAFYAIEAHPYDGEILLKAQSDLVDAYKVASKEPWVLLGVSRLILNQGYVKGDRTDLSSYQADKVQAAQRYAKEAVDNGPDSGIAHAHLARLQIITGNYRGAWEELNRAHELDPEGFYAWYFRAVVDLKMGDAKRGSADLAEAEKRANVPYQKRWVYDRAIVMAKLTRDVAAQEIYYKKTIDLLPDEATVYGNYAAFLKGQGRFDESITYYKKAIEIDAYPLAVEQLKQVQLLREANEQQRKIFDADKG